MQNALPATAGVFSVTCLFTNFAYVGFTKDMARAVKSVFEQLAGDRHRNEHFQALYDEYGREGFYVRLITKTETKEAGEALRDLLINSNQYRLNKTGRDARKDALVETFHTRWGDFTDARTAALECPVNCVYSDWMYRACFEPDRVITDADYRSSAYLVTMFEPDVIGRTFGDVGFGTSTTNRKLA